MARAKMCELVAQALDRRGTRISPIGLFSVVGRLHEPRHAGRAEQAAAVTRGVGRALLGRSGHLGEVLDWVLAYERGHFDV
jgi:c-di-GMP-related signal transduction protein